MPCGRLKGVTAPATELPAGIVTFVFTDIEGSTRLMHDLGDRYIDSLERHRNLLRRAWSDHRGHEVSAEGDAFFVAFDSADSALQACIDGQLKLQAEPWPGGRQVRVRMGIHSGLANPHAGNYVALAVHQAARVVSAAHGGQIIVSEEASRLLELPGPLHPIGRYRLRDFDSPPQLFAVSGDGFESDPREIRAVPAQGHNLARMPNQTIGRTADQERLRAEITPGRLVTLLGPGGVGKSRLANDVGMAVAPDWVDGVWRVDLAAVGQTGLVATAIGDAVGSPAHPGGDRWADTLEYLESRQVVILLDNCEHLVSKCRELVESLLTGCPGVAVVATSREPLRARGEQLWPVGPLSLPNPDEPNPADVAEAPAVQLFVERARAARPDFAIDTENAGLISAICSRLDGLPLSLELAAATLSFQSLPEIERGLEHRFRLLRSRTRRPGDRHHTMEGVLDWSYRLLSADEQAVYRRAAVFGSAFTLEAAAAAAGPGDLAGEDVPQLIWDLMDRSLVTAQLAADTTRYHMLETIRAYGLERLAEEGEVDLAAAGVANHMLERIGPWHPAGRSWSQEVAEELDNLRALIPLLESRHPNLAQVVACTIGRHHDESYSFLSGIEELKGYASTLAVASPNRVSLLATLAYLHLRMDRTEEAMHLLEEADRMRRDHGMPDWDDVSVDRAMGEVARRSGDMQGAIDIAKNALRRPLSDRGRSRMLNLLGTSSAAMGAFETALEACTKELEISRELGYTGYVASGHGNLAEIALRLGDNPLAAHHQRECLELATAQGSLPMVAFSLIVAARLAGPHGDWAEAARLHGHADTLLDEIGLVLYEDDRRQSDELLEEARLTMGDSEYEAAYADGRGLATPEAIALASAALTAAARG